MYGVKFRRWKLPPPPTRPLLNIDTFSLHVSTECQFSTIGGVIFSKFSVEKWPGGLFFHRGLFSTLHLVLDPHKSSLAKNVVKQVKKRCPESVKANWNLKIMVIFQCWELTPPPWNEMKSHFFNLNFKITMGGNFQRWKLTPFLPYCKFGWVSTLTSW